MEYNIFINIQHHHIHHTSYITCNKFITNSITGKNCSSDKITIREPQQLWNFLQEKNVSIQIILSNHLPCPNHQVVFQIPIKAKSIFPPAKHIQKVVNQKKTENLEIFQKHDKFQTNEAVPSTMKKIKCHCMKMSGQGIIV